MKLKYICVVSILFCLAGCAGSVKHIENEALLPEIDVIQVKENSDEALKLAQEAKLDVEVVSNKITEIDNKQIALSEEISLISAAKIEELENRLSYLVEAFKDLQAQIKVLESSISLHAAKPPVKPKDPAEATFAPSSAAELVTSSEYDVYQTALRTFNNRQYDQAIKMFDDQINQYPAGQYADNACYWKGECYYAVSDFASAIVSFKKVSDFKNSAKADDAQLKIGLSFLKMGQQGPAIEELKKLIDRYPGSEYVPRAKKYLEEIK
ncbi:MAG TPA: outer membrane protein assembly factor BamD [Chitinispirillaceae bacterium]|nr:outer membrane protein assembly factor BamD [Chitinispirillaceae bacterium]